MWKGDDGGNKTWGLDPGWHGPKSKLHKRVLIHNLGPVLE